MSAILELLKAMEHLARLGQEIIEAPGQQQVLVSRSAPGQVESRQPDDEFASFSPERIEQMRQAELEQEKLAHLAHQRMTAAFEKNGANAVGELFQRDGLMRDLGTDTHEDS